MDRGAWRATVQGVAKSQTQPERPTLHLERPFSVGFPGSSVSKESACSAGDPGSTPGSGRYPGKGNGNPVFLPGESQGRGSLVADVYGVAQMK